MIPVSEELYNQLVKYSENYETLVLKARGIMDAYGEINASAYNAMCIDFIEEIARLLL